VNEGFIADSTGSESTACKISQFITQLIVVGKDKTPKRAGKAMMHRELLTTTITVRRKIRRDLGISEIDISFFETPLCNLQFLHIGCIVGPDVSQIVSIGILQFI